MEQFEQNKGGIKMYNSANRCIMKNKENQYVYKGGGYYEYQLNEIIILYIYFIPNPNNNYQQPIYASANINTVYLHKTNNDWTKYTSILPNQPETYAKQTLNYTIQITDLILNENDGYIYATIVNNQTKQQV